MLPTKMPTRVQRTATWKKNDTQVWVGPRSKFANPFGGGNGEATATRQYLVDDFTRWMNTTTRFDPRTGEHLSLGGHWNNHLGVKFSLRQPILEALEQLRGKDLVCGCPIDQPCHADVLLELANS